MNKKIRFLVHSGLKKGGFGFKADLVSYPILKLQQKQI